MADDLCVLAVDDEADIRDTLAEVFTSQQVRVFTAADGTEMRDILARETVSVVLLDLRLPGEDGFALCRSLQDSNAGVGIIMLTGAADTIDRVLGLEMGADDYIAKPFELREVLARVRAMHRRRNASAGAAATETQQTEHRFGDCVFNTERRSLRTAGGEVVTLGAMEFDLLKALVEHPGRVLSRDQLLDYAHNRDWDPFDRSIDVRITRLRKKIEPHPGKPVYLRTVRGVGYIFTPEGDAP